MLWLLLFQATSPLYLAVLYTHRKRGTLGRSYIVAQQPGRVRHHPDADGVGPERVDYQLLACTGATWGGLAAVIGAGSMSPHSDQIPLGRMRGLRPATLTDS